MPIYVQSYRSYEGQVKMRFRWWVVVKHELSLVFKQRTFLALVILGYLPVILSVLQIVAYDTMMSNKRNPIVQALQQVQMMTVDSNTFLNFLRFQAGVVFLVALMSGAGMICNDFRNNLVDVYFAKPLNWRDYAAGKIVTVVLLCFGFTLFPAMFLWLLHLSLSPTLATFKSCWWLPWPILAFSTVLVFPCAVGVLASSALARNERYASTAVFMVLFGDLVLGKALPDMLHNSKYALVAFPLALNRIGESLFEVKRLAFNIPWNWAVVYAATISLISLLIVCRKARRAEIPA